MGLVCTSLKGKDMHGQEVQCGSPHRVARDVGTDVTSSSAALETADISNAN